MSRRAAGSLALLFGALSIGCEPAPETVRLEVYSWWDEFVEIGAFESVARVHEDSHDNVEVANVARAQAKDSRTHMARRLLAGAPPATFQANIGADLLRWTVVDVQEGLYRSSNLIRGLSGLFEAAGLEAALPPEVLAAVKVGGSGEPFAVPINIHRMNVLYYNDELRTDFVQNRGGQDFLNFDTLCPADPISATKLDLRIAVADGDNHEWTLVLLLLENLLPAIGGAEFYEELFRGAEPGSADTNVRRALECYYHLSKSFILRPNWAEAVNAVAFGDAEFAVMGDWANGQLEEALDGGWVSAVPFPNTEGIFVFTSDTFPLPIGVEHEAEALEFLQTIASRECQIAFNRRKGSIPALDIPNLEAELGGKVGERAQQTREQFDTGKKVLATSGLFPPAYPVEDLGNRLQEIIRADTLQAAQAAIEAARIELRDAWPLLRRWQERLTQPVGEPGLP